MSLDGRTVNPVGVFEGVTWPSVVTDIFSSAIHGNQMYVDNGRKNEIKKYSFNGKLVSVIRWRDPLISISESRLREMADRRTPINVTGRARAAETERLMSLPRRPFFPAYMTFFVDKVGRLWVMDYGGAQNGRYAPDYTVFDSNGTLLGRFQIPLGEYSRGVVTDAGHDYVVVHMRSRETGVTIAALRIAPNR